MLYDSTTDIESFECDGYKLFKVKNVSRYAFEDHKSNAWSIEYQNKIEDENKNYYLIIENRFRNAFAHWVYECAVYLPIFHKLKEIYPDIKIIMLERERKTYNKLFFDYFSINSDDVIYINTDPFFTESNICFFPTPILALNENIITDTYKKYIDRFFNIFEDNPKKTINILCAPRQRIDNSAPQDRTLDMSDIITKITDFNIGHIMHTDSIQNLIQQKKYISDQI